MKTVRVLVSNRLDVELKSRLYIPRFRVVPECVTIAYGHQAVAGKLCMTAPDADSRKWIAGIVVAVVLGEAIWGFLVSITSNLFVPAMARAMGGDAQSPLYLGNGDFNFQALFISVLELCFAGITAVLLNAWSQKPRHARPKSVRATPVEAPATPIVAPPAASPAATAADTATHEAAAPVRNVPSPPEPPPQSPKVAKPAKPQPPKEVYYNIVGEPLDPDDE